MRSFKALRRAGVAACLAASLLAVSAILASAASPVQSNPFAQQATLTASNEIGKSLLGSAVALDRDGDTALVGGPQDNNGIGAVWVFTRRGSTWTQQAKLTGGGAIGSAQFGTGVALSSDGKTALIGGPGDNSGLGAGWVFTRRGSTWRPPSPRLDQAALGWAVRHGATLASCLRPILATRSPRRRPFARRSTICVLAWLVSASTLRSSWSSGLA